MRICEAMKTSHFYPAPQKRIRPFIIPAVLICGLIPTGIICVQSFGANKNIQAGFWVLTYLAICCAVLLIARVISLQSKVKIMEKHLSESNRLGRLGAVTGKVAHNLNNALSGIATYPEVIMLEHSAESSIRKGLSLISDSGKQASGVVRDLLIISQAQETDKERLNLNLLCQSYFASKDFEALKVNYPDVKIDLEFCSDLPDIQANYIQIEKVVEKLLAFSLNELAATKSSVVRVETVVSRISRAEAGYYGMAPGKCAACRISYTEPFMKLEDLRQVFEPFFVSKHLGKKETGIGLTLALFVMENHDGAIDFQTDENQTCFELYFPVLKQ